MSPLRVRYIAAESDQSSWLTDVLSSASDMDATVDEVVTGSDSDAITKSASEPSGADIAVLDARLGTDAIRSALLHQSMQTNGIPFVVAGKRAEAPEFIDVVPRGAQDLLIIGDDSPRRIVLALQFAFERHRLLRATQSAEARIRAVVEHLAEGVVILDSDERVVYANPATEDHLERPLPDLFGQKLPVDIPDREYAVATVQALDGTPRYLSIHRLQIVWEERKATLLTLTDISAEQEAREQLNRARKEAENIAAMKSSFFANMSHELRLPLASIIGFGQLIEEEIENEELREFARMIQEGGQNLLNTINSVLDMTRLESRGLDITLEAVPVAAVVVETVRMARSLARNKGIRLDADGDDSLVVLADPMLLERVLTNLIGNAIKFTDEGQVFVSYKRADDMARIDVVDTGVGIDPEFVPRMFEEFTQESTGRDRSHGGSGLGLAISKRLVESMHGRIDVQTEKNVGTTMRILLPLAADEDEADVSPT